VHSALIEFSWSSCGRLTLRGHLYVMKTRVWDVPVRLLHGGLALSVGGAAITGGSVRWATLHVAFGAAAAVLVLLRIYWGLSGERWARFSSFGRPPGHTKAASVSALAALLLVLLLGLTGALVLGGEEQRGLLAGALSVGRGMAVHEVHEALAWGMGAWLGVHLLGVLRQSWLERQNLALGMLDGHKRGETPPVRPRVGVALVMGLGAAAASLAAIPGPGPEQQADATWARECGDCHLAYPPGLLPARSWQALLASEDHFGEVLGLGPDTVTALSAWAAPRSAEAGWDEHAVRIARSVPPEQVPQKITELPWWKELHQGSPEADLRCEDCHERAAWGQFDQLVTRRNP
jgi:cytochrome b